jgi:hypothetical protein
VVSSWPYSGLLDPSSHLKRRCSLGERHDDESSGSNGKGLEETINDAL